MERLLILLAILIALDLYAFQAVREWIKPYSINLRRGVTIGYWLLSVLSVGYLLVNVYELNENWPKPVKVFSRAFLFIFYLSKVPVAGVLLIDDLRRLVTFTINYFSKTAAHDVTRSRFMSTMGLILGGIPLATLTYGMVRNPYRYRTMPADVVIAGLPDALDGLKVVQISDMHSGSWTATEPLQRAVDLINAEAADLVCFTGDIVNNVATEMEPFVDIFKQVEAKHGVYSILGNHDYGDYHDWADEAAKTANLERLYGIHRELGWDLLRDEHRMLDINGSKLGVLGVENWSTLRFGKRGDLAKAHAGTEAADAKILLSHDPTHWDGEVKEYQDIDLTLSGHTHGFQFGVEIPGFKWSPAKYIYKQWAGLYQEGRQYLYVNRGLGFLGYPGRVGILPEITVLKLKKG
ncbi:phosphoesterase [Lewinellaceae bacterium SD302]|nr:phosphoesterase [Lewinellaceae bacterium SD302]